MKQYRRKSNNKMKLTIVERTLPNAEQRREHRNGQEVLGLRLYRFEG